MVSSIPNRWTLTTTAAPECRRAVWVCPIEAAASGSQSNSANTPSTPPSSSASSTATTFSFGSGGAWFCNRASSSAISAGTRSIRVAAI